jgi:hypothetical protein
MPLVYCQSHFLHFLRSPPLAYITPLLYFNLGLKDLRSSTKKVLIKPISKPEPPPIADSVMAARVASPATSELILLPVLYENFRKWFTEAERVVCEGDIISIPFDGGCLSVIYHTKEDVIIEGILIF